MGTCQTILPRVAKTGYILAGALFCLAGVVLIAVPGLPVPWLRFALGGLFAAFGVVKILGYFSHDLFALAFQYDLGFGLVLLVIGFAALVRPMLVLHFLCSAMGLYILADGLLKIGLAAQARKFGIEAWWSIAAAGIVAGALGTALVLRPSQNPEPLVILLGVNLVGDGILNLITVLLSVKIWDPGKGPEPDGTEPDTF